MGEYAIQTENIVKYFDGRRVLDGIDLKVPQGGIYGLLGRNGAGKTTIIRILLGLEPATRGRAIVLGASSWQLPVSVLGQIGYVAEGHNLIPNYSVRRIAELYRNLSAKWNEQFFRRLIETFRLPMERKVSQLSRGMRAQLNLSLAMATEPKLLILDDPTLGLDTVARRQFLELAVELISRDGRTLEVAHTGLARVRRDDLDDRLVAEHGLRGLEAVGLDLPRHEVVLGDVQLLFDRVAGEVDDLHAVAQRRRDGVQLVGRGDEENLARSNGRSM